MSLIFVESLLFCGKLSQHIAIVSHCEFQENAVVKLATHLNDNYNADLSGQGTSHNVRTLV